MTEPETGTSSEVYSDLEKSAQDSENLKSFSDYNTDTSVSVKLVGPLWFTLNVVLIVVWLLNACLVCFVFALFFLFVYKIYNDDYRE